MSKEVEGAPVGGNISVEQSVMKVYEVEVLEL